MKDHEQIKADLAKSGYSVPDDRFAEDPNAGQPSTEQRSGDGGKAAAEIDPSQSEHGYHGKLLSQADLANKAGAPAPENKAAKTNGGDVQYASPAAKKLAAEVGLTADDFAGVEPSSEDGYTKADVEAAAEAKG